MLDLGLEVLLWLEDAIWVYFCFPFIVLMGLYFSWKSRFVQIKSFPTCLGNFFTLLKQKHVADGKVHPLQAFFACVGGCIGIGNIVAVCTAVTIGGPGALLWLWLTATLGAIIKYSEVYLGIKYRIVDAHGHFRGGPMYYLQRVFSGSWAPITVSLLLCFYGVEVYQFSIMASSISLNFDLPKVPVVGVLLVLVLYAAWGGIRRVGTISAATVPLFVIVYCSMGAYVIFQNAAAIPEVLGTVFTTAFTGHAAVGGFIGSTLLIAVTQGIRRACYTGDIGIGYAAVIHSESSVIQPEKQASLVIVDIFLDTFIICTTTILLILVTGVWKENIPQELMVQTALGTVFSHVEWFMPFFLFLLGFSTINAYFAVGLNCAQFLGGSTAKVIYFIYAAIALALFSFVDPTVAQTIMTSVGGLLLILNCYGIYVLRNEVGFDIDKAR